MKKLISLIIAVVLVLSVPLFASAEIDLSGLSWDELIALKAQIDMEMLGRDEWQEVEVPQGAWKVGEDIPAGKWTIRCTASRSATVSWGTALNAAGDDIDYHFGRKAIVHISHPDRNTGDDPVEYIVDVQDGEYIVVSQVFGSVTFSPFKGKPSLGFK